MRISDWSSDVCSSDLASRWRVAYRRVGLRAGAVKLRLVIRKNQGPRLLSSRAQRGIYPSAAGSLAALGMTAGIFSNVAGQAGFPAMKLSSRIPGKIAHPTPGLCRGAEERGHGKK